MWGRELTSVDMRCHVWTKTYILLVTTQILRFVGGFIYAQFII